MKSVATKVHKCYISVMMDLGFIPVDDKHVKKEKQKARELRQTQWWKRKKADGICHYCKQKFQKDEITMDHLVPIIRGGRSTKGNVVPCCKECNTKKKYMLPIEWQEYVESLGSNHVTE